MDLNLSQKRLVFVVVVVVLVGLGVYLIGSRHSGGTPAAAPSPSASSAQPSASATPAVYTPPATLPAATPVSTAGGAEIYQWLPFTPPELTAAANTTLAVAKDYATWSYTEDEAAYGAKLSGLVKPAEVTSLEYYYSTSGVAGPRAADKQVSTGSGTIDSIRSFGENPLSITFVVTINQQVTSTQPVSKVSSQYAVTLVSAGNNWQVTDLELSQLGNQ
jgi:hypothetical protein